MIWRTLSAVALGSIILPIATYATGIDRSPSAPVSPEIVAQATGGKHFDRSFGKKFMEQLNLTPEQKESIETIKEQSREDKENLRQQMQEAREQMRSLMAGNATDQQLRQQHQQLQSLHQQLGSQRFETMLKIRQVLTPEQRTQLAELMQQHRGRGGHGRRQQ